MEKPTGSAHLGVADHFGKHTHTQLTARVKKIAAGHPTKTNNAVLKFACGKCQELCLFPLPFAEKTRAEWSKTKKKHITNDHKRRSKPIAQIKMFLWPSSGILSQTNSVHLKQSNSKFTIAIKTRLTPNIQPSVRKTNAVIKSFWAVSFHSLLLLLALFFFFFIFVTSVRLLDGGRASERACMCVCVCLFTSRHRHRRFRSFYSVSQSPIRSCFSSPIVCSLFTFSNSGKYFRVYEHRECIQHRIKKQTKKTRFVGG